MGTELGAKAEDDPSRGWFERTPLSPRVSDAETSQIAESMARLLEAAVPHSRMFALLLGAQRSAAARRGLEAVRDHVAAGRSFYDGFRARGRLWPRYFVELIRCAEMAGRLPEALDEAAAHFKGMARLRRTAHMMWLGPAIILAFGAFVRMMLRLYFAGTKDTLALLRDEALFILPLVAVILLFVCAAPLRRIVDRILLAIPVVSETMRDLAVCQFTRCFQLLYAGGATPQTVVRLAANAVGNTHYRQRLRSAADEVAQGAAFSDAIEPRAQWPAGYMDNFRAAETSGEIETELEHLARRVRQDLELRIEAARRITQRIAAFAVMMAVAFEVLRLSQNARF